MRGGRLARARRLVTSSVNARDLEITDRDGETTTGDYTIYQPSAQEMRAMGVEAWVLDGARVWVQSVTDEDGRPAHPLPRGGIFTWDGALFELEGAPPADPRAASVRSLATMKERTDG